MCVPHFLAQKPKYDDDLHDDVINFRLEEEDSTDAEELFYVELIRFLVCLETCCYFNTLP